MKKFLLLSLLAICFNAQAQYPLTLGPRGEEIALSAFTNDTSFIQFDTSYVKYHADTFVITTLRKGHNIKTASNLVHTDTKGQIYVQDLSAINKNIFGGGALSVSNGGTGLTSAGSSGQVLTIISGSPVWTSPSLSVVSSPSTGNSITSGTAFQPSTTSNYTINVITTLSGALGLTGDIVISYSSTQTGTYTTYARESLSLLVAGTVYSSESITLPANTWVKVTLTSTGLATISSVYTKVTF